MKKILGLFLILILIAPGMVGAADMTPVPNEQVRRSDDLGQSSTATVAQSYQELLAAIRGVRQESQARVEKAVAQERVREAWEIGKLIDEFVLQKKERAEYGKQVIKRLAGDLGTSDTELGYMLEFFRAYPIYPHAGKLNWSEYRDLLSVNDPEKRDAIAEEAVKNNWSRAELREAVRRAKQGQVLSAKVDLPLPAIKPGIPGTYRYEKATVGPETGRGVIDLGFSNFYRTSKSLGYKDGAIIEVRQAFPESSSPSDRVRLSKRTAEDLYTYRAWVISVLDGDTIKAVVDLGFGVRSVQVLRFRGIDAPELPGQAGSDAKKFLEDRLPPDTEVLIKTEKSDKYDRYLVDIWIGDLYLNQALLNKGHAVRVRV